MTDSIETSEADALEYTPSRGLPLLGISAQARAGKSTVAAFLERSYGYRQVSFAEPIRQFVSQLTGISREELEGPLKEQVVPWIGKSPRQLMQTLGTEWGRDLVREDFWVARAMREVDTLSFHHSIPAVISDVRFDNEAERIRAHAGFILHLVRPDALKVSTHPSEAGIRRQVTDYVIVNDGTLEDLHENVRKFMVGLGGSKSYQRAFR